MSKKKKATPINVDLIDLERMKERTVDLPGLIEFAHSAGGFAVSKIDPKDIRGRKEQSMGEQTGEQMEMVYQQMQTLAKQAQDLKNRIWISEEIYRAEIPFSPVSGEEYYLYERDDGTRFLSMISPTQWKKEKHLELARVILMTDRTWKVIEKFEKERED